MKKLGIRQESILFEAARRLETFHKGEDPLKAWTGLGMPSEYKTAVTAGFMAPTSREVPKCVQWYVLTAKGLAAIKTFNIRGNKSCRPEVLKHTLRLS